ncbi:MAG: (Fe-S)-binding protein [Thermodesulfobacteriota bacterium]
MDRLKVLASFSAIFIFSLLLFPPFSKLEATEFYALRLSGSDCTLCHTDPKTGSLNPAGMRFQEEGYRYPITWKAMFFYFLGGLTSFVIVFGFYLRYRLWRIGKEEATWSRWKERWKGVFIYVFGHRRVLRSLFPGVSHLLLFWSFFILTLSILILLIQEYVVFPLTGLRFFDFRTYPYFRLTLDFSGVIGWIGTICLAGRRYLLKPRELDDQGTDAFALALLFFLFLTGFSLTGIRNQLYQSSWSQWSPAASLIGGMLTTFFREEAGVKICFSALWWSHLFLSLGLLSYLPFSRLLHNLSSPLSIFFRNLEAKGALASIDIENSETYGAGRLEEFSWRHLLELDACTRCGRCQEACPAHLTGKPLNPKKVIQDLKRHMERPLKERDRLQLVGDVITEEVIWECTTCRNCLEHCPVFIEPMIKLIEFRRNLALHHGRVPRETYFAFRNIERKGNPWGFDPAKRMWWTKELGVKEMSPGEEVDLLFWVGCYGSYDDRNIDVATCLIHILNRVGINFGVLGNTEWCCGIDLRRMGGEHLFQVNVEKNMNRFQQLKFQRILTTCPHCFNTLKNEYPQFGAKVEVIHYTTLLEQLMQSGKIALRPGDGKRKITYHDSCYLGRYNDGYDPPRRILGAMDDLLLSEMKRSREKAFCCGGGGCHMWMEEKVGRRINETRVEEAAATGAEIIATVCPLCMISLDSAVKVLNLDERIRVLDILELVKERMKP